MPTPQTQLGGGPVTCWEESPAPTFPTKVDGRDAEALLDTGNTVSLIQPQLVGEHNRTPENLVAVSCIRGDTKEYNTAVEAYNPSMELSTSSRGSAQPPGTPSGGSRLSSFLNCWEAEGPVQLSSAGRPQPHPSEEPGH